MLFAMFSGGLLVGSVFSMIGPADTWNVVLFGVSAVAFALAAVFADD